MMNERHDRHSWRRLIPPRAGRKLAAVAALAAASAQGAAALAQGEAGGQSVFTPSKSYVVDIVLLVGLVGAALFAICRSSRRS